MPLRSLLAVLLFVTAPLSDAVADAGGDTDSCESAVDGILELIDDTKADELAKLFPDHIAAPPEYFRTWLGILLREYGHLTETVRDDNIDLTKFTEYGMESRGLTEPFSTFKFRTIYHHEGEGIVVLKLSGGGGSCMISNLFFGIPRSRPDAMSRYYEISTRISAEMAAALQ